MHEVVIGGYTSDIYIGRCAFKRPRYLHNASQKFLLIERKVDMFVIVSTYQAKVGEEDAIIALHEDWQRTQGPKAIAYISWELLRKVNSPREFIAIAYFSSEELAKAAESDLKQDAWYGRLVSLIEEGPIHTDCIREWQLR